MIGVNSLGPTMQYCCQPVRCVNRRAERILLGIVGLDHDPNAVRPNRFADRDSGHVVAALVEPAANRRIDAEVLHFEQCFTFTQFGDFGVDRFEARLGHHADGALRKDDLPVDTRRSNHGRKSRA